MPAEYAAALVGDVSGLSGVFALKGSKGSLLRFSRGSRVFRVVPTVWVGAINGFRIDSTTRMSAPFEVVTNGTLPP